MSLASRHDHYPRTDPVRAQALRRAATDMADAWRAEDAGPGGLSAALDAAAVLAPDAALAHLLAWLADIGWLRGRLGEALALLAADPFARPPLRLVGGGDAPGGLILAERGAIRLSLQLLPFTNGAASPESVLFVPGRVAMRVLADGGADLTLLHAPLTLAEEAGAFTANDAAPCHSDMPRPLVTGEVIRLDTSRTGFVIDGAVGDVLLLELTVQPPSPLPMRLHDLASGRLIHLSASCRDSSFRQMALTLLRTMERRDTTPLFAEATRAADFSLRWSAMRDFVALDPSAAYPRLHEMASDDPHPDVRRAAAATLALYPAEVQPCPA